MIFEGTVDCGAIYNRRKKKKNEITNEYNKKMRIQKRDSVKVSKCYRGMQLSLDMAKDARDSAIVSTEFWDAVINECGAISIGDGVTAGGITYGESRAVYPKIKHTIRVAISGTMAVLTGTITALACVGAKEKIRRVKHK